MKKKIIVETIEKLPDEFPLDELIEKQIVLDKIERGLIEVKEGRVLIDEEAKQRLA